MTKSDQLKSLIGELVEAAKDYGLSAEYGTEEQSDSDLDTLRAARERLNAALTEAEKRDGWALVPREPTEAMMIAGYRAEPLDRGRADNMHELIRGHMLPIYRAMIAAVPATAAKEE